MALQKDYDIKGVMAAGAYHKIKELHILEDTAIVVVGIYKDFASSADTSNEITGRRYAIQDVEGGDQNYTDYLSTVHATDNVFKRAETYLIDKEADYSGASVI